MHSARFLRLHVTTQVALQRSQQVQRDGERERESEGEREREAGRDGGPRQTVKRSGC